MRNPIILERNFMKRSVIILLAILACWCLPLHTEGSVSLKIEQSGFDPAVVDLYQETSNYLNAYLIYDQTGEEIPTDQCQFAWSVYQVWWDPDGTGDYFDNTNNDNYAAWITDGDHPNCCLTAEVYDGGGWYIYVTVTVTYPDGYAKTFNVPVSPGNPVYLAGESEQGRFLA